MIGPIPNSLAAGGYNGDAFAHGAVTFSSRAAVILQRLQEVCVDAILHGTLALASVIHPDLPLTARLDQIFSTGAVLHDTLTTDAELLRALQIESIFEEC